jgi:hypothetical protein
MHAEKYEYTDWSYLAPVSMREPETRLGYWVSQCGIRDVATFRRGSHESLFFPWR